MNDNEKYLFDLRGYLVVKNVLSKSLGSNNQLSVVTATMNGLSKLRTAKEISEIRGEEVNGPSFTTGNIDKSISASLSV